MKVFGSFSENYLPSLKIPTRAKILLRSNKLILLKPNKLEIK